MSTARAGIGKLIEHTVPFLFVIMPPPSCPIQVGADAIKVIPYLCPPPPSNQVGTDAMNAMAQSKKVEEALGQAVVAGEALKRGLAQEGARGDQVGVERDREEECTEKMDLRLAFQGGPSVCRGTRWQIKDRGYPCHCAIPSPLCIPPAGRGRRRGPPAGAG